MKLRVMSDIHLEFGNLEVEHLPYDKETILVLAGDIHISIKALPFIKDMCNRFKHVIYVLGNHEFYGYNVHTVKHQWRDISSFIDNLHFLDDSYVIIDNVKFLGSTFWTNANNANPNDINNIKSFMHEFSGTIPGWSVEDSIYAHNKSINFLHDNLTDEYINVVITHHLPSYACITEKFEGSPINAGFASNDTDYLFEMFNINTWIYGHTHDAADFMYKGTRLFCNPRGYIGHEPHAVDYDQTNVLYINKNKDAILERVGNNTDNLEFIYTETNTLICIDSDTEIMEITCDAGEAQTIAQSFNKELWGFYEVPEM